MLKNKQVKVSKVKRFIEKINNKNYTLCTHYGAKLALKLQYVLSAREAISKGAIRWKSEIYICFLSLMAIENGFAVSDSCP